MTKQRMKAVVLEGIKNLKIIEREIPKINENEALVAIKAVGICGSDVHYYEQGKIGRYIVQNPLVLGHETSGEVVAIGEKVRKVKVGDRVAIEPGHTCGKCKYCKEGRYNLCPEVKFFATPPIDGALCEYVVVPEDYLFRIPNEMSFEIATLAEPLSVGIHAAQRSNIKMGDTVLILGLGPVGLLSILAAKSYGASKIIAVDIETIRLEAAKKIGATYVLNGKDEAIRQKILDFTNGEGPDVTFETAGSKTTYEVAFEVTKRGGRIVTIGLLAEDKIPLNVNAIVDNEYTIYGVFRYANTYEKAIEVLSKNIEKAKELITHRFKLEESAQAFEFVRNNKDKSIKVIITI